MSILKSKKMVISISIVVLLIVGVVVGIVLNGNSYDFRNVRWGMTIKEVMDAEDENEDSEFASENNNAITYIADYQGYKSCLTYKFDDKSKTKKPMLNEVLIRFYDYDIWYENKININECDNNELYEALKTMFISNYGKPIKENETLEYNLGELKWISKNSKITIKYDDYIDINFETLSGVE